MGADGWRIPVICLSSVNKETTMKITPVKGTNDYLPNEVEIRDYLQNEILKVYVANGF